MLFGSPYFFEVPMAVIGKVYANSMLVLLNSRVVLLGPDENSLRAVSSLNFGAAPTNDSHVLVSC